MRILRIYKYQGSFAHPSSNDPIAQTNDISAMNLEVPVLEVDPNIPKKLVVFDSQPEETIEPNKWVVTESTTPDSRNWRLAELAPIKLSPQQYRFIVTITSGQSMNFDCTIRTNHNEYLSFTYDPSYLCFISEPFTGSPTVDLKLFICFSSSTTQKIPHIEKEITGEFYCIVI